MFSVFQRLPEKRRTSLRVLAVLMFISGIVAFVASGVISAIGWILHLALDDGTVRVLAAVIVVGGGVLYALLMES